MNSAKVAADMKPDELTCMNSKRHEGKEEIERVSE
jgi:hypothetical protein